MFNKKFHTNKPFSAGLKRRIILTLIILLPPLHSGFINSYPSVANAHLSLPIDQLSWFGSAAHLTAPLGALLAGFIIDKYGRKPAIIFCFVPTTIGWFLQYLAANENFALLLIGRVLLGFNSGASPYPSQVYVTECIAGDHLRLKEALALSMVTALGLGELVVYLLGYFFDYQQICIIFTASSLLSFILGYVSILESPLWFYYNGRRGDAEWVEKELGLNQTFLESEVFISLAPTPKITKKKSFSVRDWISSSRLGLLRQNNIYRPLIVTTTLIILSKLNGGTILTTYLLDIMSGPDTQSDQNAYTYSTFGQVLVLVANILCSFVVPVTGVKAVSLVSAIGLIFGMLLMANSSALLDHGLLASRVVGIWLSMFTIHFGISSVLKAVISEAFPIYAKGFGCVPTIAFNLCGALVLKIYPYLAAQFGDEVFYGCAISTIAYAVIFHYFVPETVGKSLVQINKELS